MRSDSSDPSPIKIPQVCRTFPHSFPPTITCHHSSSLCLHSSGFHCLYYCSYPPTYVKTRRTAAMTDDICAHGLIIYYCQQPLSTFQIQTPAAPISNGTKRLLAP